MQTKIGTPPREVLLLVDTASELTWVQGTSCTNCSPTKVPPFNPGLSSSFISEPCTSSVCLGRSKLGFQSACNRSTGSCSFQVAYLDGSEAYGVIAREIFSLQSWDGAASTLGDVIFGCASKDLQRPVDFSSGTLGLNRGSFSFPAQIGSRSKSGLSDRFSYCFPNRAEHLNSSGVIIFGDSGIPAHHFQYLSLEQEPPIASIVDFYYVGLQGISVGGELLHIPRSAFKIDRLGNGGTYFDSGTTVSFLVEPAHTALVEAFGRRVLHLNRTSGSDFTKELCYDVAAGDARLPTAPLVTLHFKNNVDMELREASVWVPLARTPQVVTICLAFVNAGAVAQGGVNVIGNYQQQDYLIEHDLERSRIGFAPANCVMD
ncbi:hypothetical protein SELMODRAFT_105896 [Selaginella moellendorffii]|uniref:Peptidase A1 domain-containing protein n=2 Tax=Selaginella moellendorffii TaxID=88036 RepID=D8S0E4_SELML|nr:hypothetical protein SELMODRAFT_105896 [Selaginella moellendorffii]